MTKEQLERCEMFEQGLKVVIAMVENIEGCKWKKPFFDTRFGAWLLNKWVAYKLNQYSKLAFKK